jgi:hypothetical protein
VQHPRSELQRPVEGLFSTPRPERQQRALRILRELRGLVARDGLILPSLGSLEVCVEREFARSELRRALLPGLELEQLDRHGDLTLRLYFVDRALRACGALHRGGHLVSGGRRSA